MKGAPGTGRPLSFAATSGRHLLYDTNKMLTQRCWTILAHSIGVTLLAALLWGMVLLVERHVGDRRKAVGWVFGVYLIGGAIWGATVAHVLSEGTAPGT